MLFLDTAAFHGCITNCYKRSGLYQQTFITSQFLQVRSPATSQVESPGRQQGVSQGCGFHPGPGILPQAHRLLAELLPCGCLTEALVCPPAPGGCRQLLATWLHGRVRTRVFAVLQASPSTTFRLAILQPAHENSLCLEILVLTGVLGLLQQIEIDQRPVKKVRPGFIGVPAAGVGSESKQQVPLLTPRGGASCFLTWGERRGVSRGQPEGWLTWCAHPLGGVVRRGHVQGSAFSLLPIICSC